MDAKHTLVLKNEPLVLWGGLLSGVAPLPAVPFTPRLT